MIKKPVMRRFLKQHIIPEFDRFFIHKDDMLLRITDIFLHGIYFQRSAYGDDFYVYPFVEFLPDGVNFIGMTIGGRVGRADSPNHYREVFFLSPPEEESDQIVSSIRTSRYYPHIVHPTCRSLLESFDGEDRGSWTDYGLACCAIMEGELERGERLFRRFYDETEWLKNSWAAEPRNAIEKLLRHSGNLDWCRDFLWRRAEESIRLKKLEKIADLSGWKPG